MEALLAQGRRHLASEAGGDKSHWEYLNEVAPKDARGIEGLRRLIRKLAGFPCAPGKPPELMEPRDAPLLGQRLRLACPSFSLALGGGFPGGAGQGLDEWGIRVKLRARASPAAFLTVLAPVSLDALELGDA